ncbi:UNKNOWN [Stylonychia lemnae]|uniref:Uncharacterized protein n=1 Tax=Stylonychia lemnae TaxID=5949 RepID=A0A078A3P5_STYLE|nr:UNKNOWN [Stylonychia lemnae]|eukprot:CDW76153.1 UNKNOWN [Stylonychia lemnae]
MKPLSPQSNPLQSMTSQEAQQLSLEKKMRAAENFSQLKSMQHIRNFQKSRRCLGNHKSQVIKKAITADLVIEEEPKVQYEPWSDTEQKQHDDKQKKNRQKFKYEMVQVFQEPIIYKEKPKTNKRVGTINEFDSLSLFAKFQNLILHNQDEQRPSNHQDALNQKLRIQKAIENSQRVFQGRLSEKNFINQRKRIEEYLEQKRYANIDMTTRGDLRNRTGRLGRLKRIQQELAQEEKISRKQLTFDSFDKSFREDSSQQQITQRINELNGFSSRNISDMSITQKIQDLGKVKFMIAPQFVPSEITLFGNDKSQTKLEKSSSRIGKASQSQISSPRYNRSRISNTQQTSPRIRVARNSGQRAQTSAELQKIERIIEVCSKNDKNNQLLKVAYKKHDLLDQRREDVQSALHYLDEQNEEPQLSVKENLEVNNLIEEQMKFRKSNFELFGSPDVLKRFLDIKNKSTIFISKNGQKKIWRGQRLPKKILDIVQEVR